MTTTTDSAQPIALEPPGPGVRRFALAFVLGLVAALVLGVGALYAFDRLNAGHVLPGVRVGSVDLSGLAPDAARERLAAAYGSLADGSVVLRTSAGDRAIAFSKLGRHADVDAMVAAALGYGRTGSTVDQLIGDAKTALRGVVLDPIVTFDQAALDRELDRAAASFAIKPTEARVSTADKGFTVVEGANGRHADRGAIAAELAAALGSVDAPSTIETHLALITDQPTVTTAEAIGARVAADRIAQDVKLVLAKESWTIPAATVRSWVRFVITTDGSYQPVVDATELTPVLNDIARKVKRDPKNASFLIGKGNAVIGVTAGRNGRALDVPATATAVSDALRARAVFAGGATVAPAVVETKPALSTEEAQKSAPLMREISRWTTWFPISEKNGFGANIWIPAMDIDGYVVGPGETFDFWKAVGPITRARGYRDGGAIINGRTEPQGALAGGICSCSTTLFNAALRAGFEMGARRNHYYYIDRYPIGLDATVFKSGSGSVQTMSWKNDTKYPVLIRGQKIRSGSKGYVRFILYSVPTNRKVTFSTPIVKNIRPASDSTQYTSTLAAGTRKRIEYPVDGKDVWVTRTVTDRATGKVIHRETYYSHYSRITGVVLIGTAGAPTPAASPSPAPSPVP